MRDSGEAHIVTDPSFEDLLGRIRAEASDRADVMMEEKEFSASVEPDISWLRPRFSEHDRDLIRKQSGDAAVGRILAGLRKLAFPDLG